MSTIDHLVIKELDGDDELAASVHVIRSAFTTVASDFGLTQENCPTNPAFIALDVLRQMRDKGLKFFGAFHDFRQIGFVAIERASDELYYLEKLAVLPDFRHRGCGVRLMDFACEYIGTLGGAKVSIGIIDENSVLKNWYKAYGFAEIRTSRFENLPFLVCLMEKDLR